MKQRKSLLVALGVALVVGFLLFRRGSEPKARETEGAASAASSPSSESHVTAASPAPSATAPTVPAPAASADDRLANLKAGSIPDPYTPLTTCLLSCLSERTPDQVRADETNARAYNVREMECGTKCDGDAGCKTTCVGGALRLSSVGCEDECSSRFPIPHQASSRGKPPLRSVRKTSRDGGE